MNVWFTRANGTTVHNDPASQRYIAGEPPQFPATAFNYCEECLKQGFARLGWPAAGDLLKGDWQDRADAAYSAGECSSTHRKYLESFRSIKTGDLIVMPAYERNRYDVHVGRVVRRDRESRSIIECGEGVNAYYYFHKHTQKAWYENAHRVDVQWHRDDQGLPSVHHVPNLGGIWLRAFGAVKTASREIVQIAE